MVGLTAGGAFTEAGPPAGGGPVGGGSGLRRTFAAALRHTTRGGAKRGLAAAAPTREAKQAKLNRGPTRVVLLTNLVGAGDVDEDLEEETAEEAAKYGKLLECTIKECKGAPDKEAVRIFLEFQKVEMAAKCYKDMNGRFFGGRSVKARFFDEDKYAKGELDRRVPTRVLLLTNLVEPEDVDEELQTETAAELAKFGPVSRCVVRTSPQATGGDDDAVRVYAEFASAEDAAKAQQALHGRVFGGREVTVRFFEEEQWSAGNF